MKQRISSLEGRRNINLRDRFNVNERVIDKAYFENNGFHEPVFFPNGKRPPGLEVGDDSMTLDKVVQTIGEEFRIRWVHIEFDQMTKFNFTDAAQSALVGQSTRFYSEFAPR